MGFKIGKAVSRIGKKAKKAVKAGTKASKVTGKVLTTAGKVVGTSSQVLNTVGTTTTLIWLATGQPEIVAAGVAASGLGTDGVNLGNASVAGGRAIKAKSKGKNKKATKKLKEMYIKWASICSRHSLNPFCC
jgi:hypothetical protein